jgi:hypothetical protein
MPYDSTGEWSIWDKHDAQDIALDPFDDGWREQPITQSPEFDGHLSPNSIVTNTNADAHTESHTTWVHERKELRLYIVAGVMGQLVSAVDLKKALGKARSEHGQVDFISLVFRQGDYAARSTESANLRGWLSRNGFRKIDSYNGHGVLVEKDLTRNAEPKLKPQPRPEPKPLTALEQAQRYRDAGLNIPPYLQRDLNHEKRMQEDAQNDPTRRLEEVTARIELLEKLKAECEKTIIKPVSV